MKQHSFIWLAVIIALGACRPKHPHSHMEASNSVDQLFPVKHLSVAIHTTPEKVYALISDPKTLPGWAPGFVSSVSKQGNEWIGQTVAGPVKIFITPVNTLGIVDHKVILSNGDTIENPIRVLRNNHGAEVVFSLFRLPGKTDEEYLQDEGLVKKDLQLLKEILER